MEDDIAVNGTKLNMLRLWNRNAHDLFSRFARNDTELYKSRALFDVRLYALSVVKKCTYLKKRALSLVRRAGDDVVELRFKWILEANHLLVVVVIGD